MGAVSQRKVGLVEAGNRLLAREHHARLERFLPNAVGDHLIDRDARVDDRALLKRGARQQTAGLGRVNAQAGRGLVEQAINDIDLALQRLEGRERLAEFHVSSRALSAPVILVYAAAEEHHSKSFRESLSARGGPFSS